MIPKIIYLQIGDEVDLSFVDFKDLHKDAITWCEDKINVNDIEYINKEYSDQQNKNLLDEIDELKKLHTLGLQALLECQNEKNQLKSELKAADSVNEWISVEDRLPEINEPILGYNNVSLKQFTVIVTAYDGKVFRCFDDTDDSEDVFEYGTSYPKVTHWMPLPNKPK